MSADKELVSREEKETGRIEAFSDGVFAIAITLLVLDIKVPHPQSLPAGMGLTEALCDQWPAFLAFFISFFTILIIWSNHHRLFNYIKRSDDTFLFLNGVLLLAVTFIPFPTALLADYIRSHDAHVAAAIYSGTYLFVALVFNLLWHYASHGGHLLGRTADSCHVETISRQYLMGPPLYLAAFVFSFISVPVSVGICLCLAAFFSLTGMISRRTCTIDLRKK